MSRSLESLRVEWGRKFCSYAARVYDNRNATIITQSKTVITIVPLIYKRKNSFQSFLIRIRTNRFPTCKRFLIETILTPNTDNVDKIIEVLNSA